MKKIFALLLSFSFLLTGCTSQDVITEISEIIETTDTTTPETEISPVLVQDSASGLSFELSTEEIPEFFGINDPELCEYLEHQINVELESDSENGSYQVQKVEAHYYSKERLEEMAYNSKENIYFGTPLSKLEHQFQGQKYIFTLADNGQTMFKVFEEYDNHTEEILKTAAIVTGVIVLTVVVVYVAAPAVIAAANSAGVAGTAQTVSTTVGKEAVKQTGKFAAKKVLQAFFTIPNASDVQGIVSNVKDITGLVQDKYASELENKMIIENADYIKTYTELLEKTLSSDVDEEPDEMIDKLEIISSCAESVGMLAGVDETLIENAGEIAESSKEIIKTLKACISDGDFDIWDAATVGTKLAKMKSSASKIQQSVVQHQENSAVQIQSLQNDEPMTVIFGEVSEA